MQSFCFFGPPPSRCLAYGTQSVGKRSGGAYPKGTLRRGLVPANNKKITIKNSKYNFFI